MKFVMILSSFLLVFQVHAKNCQEIKGFEIFGETLSYEPQGEEIVKIRKWYPLPEFLSEHMGSFYNLKIKSPERINKLQILGEEYSISTSLKGNFQTKDLKLQNLFWKKKFHGQLEIKFFMDNKFFCKYETKVVASD